MRPNNRFESARRYTRLMQPVRAHEGPCSSDMAGARLATTERCSGLTWGADDKGNNMCEFMRSVTA